jgi:4-hydroxybenzoate polyprenyltransferase
VAQLRNILWALQLTRIALVFTAIADIWLITLLAHFAGETGITTAGLPLPLWAMLLCTAGVATGLYTFGMSLNDILDFRRDRTFAPQRPLPAGRIGLRGAVAITVAALLLAIVAAVPLGAVSTLLAVATAGAILFYNSIGKHMPGVGVVTLGVIRGMHMLIAAPSLAYCWPVWLTVSHVIGISAAAHRLEDKRPAMVGRQVWIVVGFWSFITLGLTLWMGRLGGLFIPTMPQLWVGPTLLAVVFIIVALRTAAAHPNHPRLAGGLIIKRGLLWLIVYDAAWLASAQLWWQAALVGVLLPAALGSMSLMRQVRQIIETPQFQRDEAA